MDLSKLDVCVDHEKGVFNRCRWCLMKTPIINIFDLNDLNSDLEKFSKNFGHSYISLRILRVIWPATASSYMVPVLSLLPGGNYGLRPNASGGGGSTAGHCGITSDSYPPGGGPRGTR